MANFGNGTNNVLGNVGTNAMARAISAYSDQEYTDNVRIAGTALVGSDARISGSDEDYFGTIRWTNTLGSLTYNTGNSSDTAETNRDNITINIGGETQDEGALTGVRHDSSQYIKTLRSMGAAQYNVTQLLTSAPNAIEKVSRDFGVARARDADAALIAMLEGVTHAEVFRRAEDGRGTAVSSTRTALNGYGQGVTLTEDQKAQAGFYFDVNGPHNTTFSDNSASNTSNMGLIDTSSMGGKAAANLWAAAAAAFGDNEPEFFYLVIDPRTYQDIRSANLLDDQDRISDGNIDVPTLLQGKFRLLITGNLGGFQDRSASAAATGFAQGVAVNEESDRVSYLMLPGSLYQSDIAVPNPVAFDTDESKGRGTGEREVWYRWGNVYHPRGYTWTGLVTAYAQNGSAAAALGAQGSVYADGIQWMRKESPRNLGILPIFHA